MKKGLFLALMLGPVLCFGQGFAQNRVSAEEHRATLQEIEKAIAEKGAKWTAGENDIFLLSPGEKKLMLGNTDSIPLAQIPSTEQMMRYRWHPEKFDWRSVNGGNWMSPVKNQGACGSCVAFAVIGTLEGQMDIYHNNPGLNRDLSEQHVFACGGGTCDGGWQTSAGFAYLLDNGAPAEACYPYASGKDGIDRPCSGTCPDWRDEAVRISCWGWVAGQYAVCTPAQIKDRLLNGPVATGMTVYEDFDSYNRGIYQHVWGGERGGHAVVFVGWDDTTDPPCWIVKNSWGSWGEAGYFRIIQGINDSGIESGCLYLTLGDVAEGKLSDNGHLFGTLEVGETETWTLGIHNEGAAYLEVYGFYEDSVSAFFITAPGPYPQSIAHGETLFYTVTFAPRAAGFQHTRMMVNSNSCVLLPELKFRGTGVIHTVTTDPKSIEQTLDQGQIKAAPFSIINAGVLPVTFEVEVLKDWIAVEPDNGVVEAGKSVSGTVTFDASALDPGQFRTNILIRTDDPTDQVVVIPVRLNIMEAAGVVVAIPATFIPMDQATWLDICLDNQTHVEASLREVSLHIAFDPALLDIENIEPAPRAAFMDIFQWQDIQPGLIWLAISDVDGNAITPDTGPVARLSCVLQALACGYSARVSLGDVTVTDTMGAQLEVRISPGPVVAVCKGDPDLSGSIDVVDVVQVVRSIAGRTCSGTWDAICWAADYNGDGKIDVRDVVSMIHVILE